MRLHSIANFPAFCFTILTALTTSFDYMLTRFRMKSVSISMIATLPPWYA